MKTTELEIINKAIIKNGVQAQVDVAIEEMSELIKALLKYRRGGSDNKLYADIIKEIADVEIMLDQLKILYHEASYMQSVEEVKKYKLLRLAKRLGMNVTEIAEDGNE